MKVTCQFCKEKIEKTEAFRIPKKQANQFHYYCNEAEYVAHQNKLEEKAKVTCQYCKMKIEKYSAYQIKKNKNTRLYYCSKEEYDNHQIEAENNKTVKCGICKEVIKKSDAFRVAKSTPNTFDYYCSKEEYDDHRMNRRKYHETLDYFALEIMDYKEDEKRPTFLQSRLKELNEFYDYDIIKMTLEIHFDYLSQLAHTKEFYNEAGRINYLMSIVESEIKNVYMKWKKQKKLQQKIASKTVSDDMAFIIDDESYFSTVRKKETGNKNSGIVNFLEDGDL